MKNIIISLLTEQEQEGITYKGALPLIEKLPNLTRYQVTAVEETFQYIRSQSSDEEPITFTFFGHGGSTGLSDNVSIRILYSELLIALNDAVTSHEIIINFLANCSSQESLNYLPNDFKIKEIWHSNNTTESITKSVLALEGWDQFYDQIYDQDRELYNIWLNPRYTHSRSCCRNGLQSSRL